MNRSLNGWLLVVLLACLAGIDICTGNIGKTELPKGWHLMDKEQDGFYGISVNKAYEFARLKKLKSKTVVVAVIDSGVDTLHEDLKIFSGRIPKKYPGTASTMITTAMWTISMAGISSAEKMARM